MKETQGSKFKAEIDLGPVTPPNTANLTADQLQTAFTQAIAAIWDGLASVTVTQL